MANATACLSALEIMHAGVSGIMDVDLPAYVIRKNMVSRMIMTRDLILDDVRCR
jgi:hypothetical protein